MHKKHFSINSILLINENICIVLNYFYYKIVSKKENGDYNIIKKYIDSSEIEMLQKKHIIYFETLEKNKISSYMYEQYKHFKEIKNEHYL